MTETIAAPQSAEAMEMVRDTLNDLPDEIRSTAMEGFAAAGALCTRLMGVHEGASAVPGSSYRIDSSETKERYKQALFTDVARNLGIQNPDSEEAHHQVRERLTWVSLMATYLGTNHNPSVI